MRFAGHNVLAILAAAVAMYFVEFLIYGVLVPPATYQAMAHLDDVDMTGNAWKMPFGIIGPLIWAVGLSIAIGWRGGGGWRLGASTGLVTAATLMIAARFFQWGYGATGLDFFALDAVHFLVVGALGGAIIGGWPAAKGAKAG